MPTSLESDLEVGERYLNDVEFRRETLEQSLAVVDNGYAELRLEHYARDWEQLPEQAPRVRPVGQADAALQQLLPGQPLQTDEAWLEFGARAFESWPAQRVAALSEVIDQPELAQRFGLWRDARGRIGGVVEVAYADGSLRHALTCASCHARPNAEGELVHGPAADLELDALTQRDPSALAGPGKVDVTADGIDNPVAISDLRALRHQRRMHWTGNLRTGLAALAVRIETQLITANAASVRPPRSVVFALALYTWTLGEEPRLPTEPVLGAQHFADHCQGCHEGPTGEGDPVAVSAVGTDPTVTESPLRGTGNYRVPSLYRVSDRTRLMHDGRFADLESLFDPSRGDADSVHPFGLTLDDDEREALLDYLGGF